MKIRGKVWLFGDEMNTDLIYPQEAFRLPVEEGIKLAFSANRPGWSDMVSPGDIIVAGEAFGTGSSRAASVVLTRLGIAGCVASSFSELFFRNAVNTGLPVLTCPGVLDFITEEREEVEVDLEAGLIRRIRDGVTRPGMPLPSQVVDIIEGGGIVASLEKRGLVAPDTTIRLAAPNTELTRKAAP